jgi:hypothetical protein
MKRKPFFAWSALAVAMICVFCAAACTAGVIRVRGKADLRLTVAVPPVSDRTASIPFGPTWARLVDPQTDTIRVTVQRSGATVAERDFELPADGGTVELTVPDIPVDDATATVTVSCRNAEGLAVCTGSADVVIAEAGTVSVSLTLAPTEIAGTTLDIGALASYAQDGALSAPAGGATLYRITTSEATEDFALSAGLTGGTATFYAADGTAVPKIGGTPEQWTVLSFGSSAPAFVLFAAPAGEAETAALGVERAVYASPSGTGSGTKAAPLPAASFNTSYATFSGPTRFLLAAGDYPGKFDLFDGGSIYGGFDAGFSTRNLGTYATRFTGIFSGTPDQILRATGINYAALDGLVVTPNSTLEGGSAVNHATIRVVNSGVRISGCTVHSPRQTLEFSFTATGNLISALSIEGQAAGMPVIVICSSFVGRGQNWALGFNSGGSSATVSLVSVTESSADILVSGNYIDGGWETDTNTNTAIENAGAVYVSSTTGQPWIVGNTIAAAGGTTTQVTLNLSAVRGGSGTYHGRLVNNLLFALNGYQATVAETNLLYPAGSTNQFNLLVWNYLANMYQGTRNSLYYDTVTRAQTVSALNSVMTGSGAASNNSGNPLNTAVYAAYKSALDQLLLDFDGPTDDRSVYAARDYRLAASAPAAVRTGGLDLSVPGNLPAGFPAAFVPYVRYDREGKPRTPGAWSIGADQAGN